MAESRLRNRLSAYSAPSAAVNRALPEPVQIPKGKEAFACKGKMIIMKFDVAKTAVEIPFWLAGYLKQSGRQGFVLHMTGDKNSVVTAALLARSCGADNVLALLTPCANEDVSVAQAACRAQNIRYKTINIQPLVQSFQAADPDSIPEARENMLEHIRMTLLYSVAQSDNLLVSGSLSQSERFVGSFTKWGDCCDLNPVGNLTTEEVQQLGEYFKLLPAAPGKQTQPERAEERLGIRYADVNRYIRTGVCENEALMKKIKKLHKHSLHKIKSIPVFKPCAVL